jgi:hypothetical protein
MGSARSGARSSRLHSPVIQIRLKCSLSNRASKTDSEEQVKTTVTSKPKDDVKSEKQTTYLGKQCRVEQQRKLLQQFSMR